MNHIPVDVGETKVSARVPIGEPFVVDSQEVEDGCLEVMGRDPIPGNLVAAFITCAVDGAPPDAGSSQPGAVDPCMMPAPIGAWGWNERTASELRRPNDQGFLEHAPALQISKQAGDRPIDVSRESIVGAHICMGVPVAIDAGIPVNQFDESYPVLRQSSGNQTLPGKGLGVSSAKAIELVGGVRLLGEIKYPGCLDLHAGGNFK